MSKVTDNKVTSHEKLEIVKEALAKLPRDDMRLLCKKVGARTGHQKQQTVHNLATVLVA